MTKKHLKLMPGHRVARCRKCYKMAEKVLPSQYCYIVFKGCRPLDMIPCAYLSDVCKNGDIEPAEWEEVTF
jgi:hypothetical protein